MRPAFCVGQLIHLLEPIQRKYQHPKNRSSFPNASVGNPQPGDFLDSRHEIATLIHRVLLKLDEIYAKKTDTGKAEGVKPEQLEEVRRLTSEFQKELLVVGADLKKAEEQIAELQRRVDAQGRDIEKN